LSRTDLSRSLIQRIPTFKFTSIPGERSRQKHGKYAFKQIVYPGFLCRTTQQMRIMVLKIALLLEKMLANHILDSQRISLKCGSRKDGDEKKCSTGIRRE
jgi:hypothetical protein